MEIEALISLKDMDPRLMVGGAYILYILKLPEA